MQATDTQRDIQKTMYIRLTFRTNMLAQYLAKPKELANKAHLTKVDPTDIQ